MNILDYFTVDNLSPTSPVWYDADPEQTECYTLIHHPPGKLSEEIPDSAYELLAFPPNCLRIAPARICCGSVSYISQLEVAFRYTRFSTEIAIHEMRKRLELKKQEIATSFIHLLCERYCTRIEDIRNFKDSLYLAEQDNSESTAPLLDPTTNRYRLFVSCNLYLFNLKAFPSTYPFYITIPEEIELE